MRCADEFWNARQTNCTPCSQPSPSSMSCRIHAMTALLPAYFNDEVWQLILFLLRMYLEWYTCTARGVPNLHELSHACNNCAVAYYSLRYLLQWWGCTTPSILIMHVLGNQIPPTLLTFIAQIRLNVLTKWTARPIHGILWYTCTAKGVPTQNMHCIWDTSVSNTA